MKALEEKHTRLKRFIKEKGKDGVIIAFSGGVDSSTLAAVCLDVLGDKVVAVTAMSPTYPRGELEDAKRMAEEIGIRHIMVKTDELADERFVCNPENRCYYCKTELFNSLRALGRKLGLKVIFEGTNFSDLGGHRPGFQAIEEGEDVFSPWVETGFTKEEIRQLAQQLGLSVHDKPSFACLSSRIPFGEQITAERLDRIEKAERVIREIINARQLRVRDHSGIARIEVGREERSLLFREGIFDQITTELKQLGFKYVTLDLEGYRTGSMTATIPSDEEQS